MMGHRSAAVSWQPPRRSGGISRHRFHRRTASAGRCTRVSSAASSSLSEEQTQTRAPRAPGATRMRPATLRLSQPDTAARSYHHRARGCARDCAWGCAQDCDQVTLDCAHVALRPALRTAVYAGRPPAAVRLQGQKRHQNCERRRAFRQRGTRRNDVPGDPALLGTEPALVACSATAAAIAP
jgi:hypothetical protein